MAVSAERMPIGSAISIQRIAPPNTSEAVTGAASRIVWLTFWRFVNERPSERSITSRFRNMRVLDEHRPVEAEACSACAMHVRRRALAAGEPGRVRPG